MSSNAGGVGWIIISDSSGSDMDISSDEEPLSNSYQVERLIETSVLIPPPEQVTLNQAATFNYQAATFNHQADTSNYQADTSNYQAVEPMIIDDPDNDGYNSDCSYYTASCLPFDTNENNTDTPPLSIVVEKLQIQLQEKISLIQQKDLELARKSKENQELTSKLLKLEVPPTKNHTIYQIKQPAESSTSKHTASNSTELFDILSSLLALKDETSNDNQATTRHQQAGRAITLPAPIIDKGKKPAHAILRDAPLYDIRSYLTTSKTKVDNSKSDSNRQQVERVVSLSAPFKDKGKKPAQFHDRDIAPCTPLPTRSYNIQNHFSPSTSKITSSSERNFYSRFQQVERSTSLTPQISSYKEKNPSNAQPIDKPFINQMIPFDNRRVFATTPITALAPLTPTPSTFSRNYKSVLKSLGIRLDNKVTTAYSYRTTFGVLCMAEGGGGKCNDRRCKDIHFVEYEKAFIS